MPKLSSLSPYLLDICEIPKCLSFAQRGENYCRWCRLLWIAIRIPAVPLFVPCSYDFL